jgi:adenine-specific DNA-methyltransferase
MSKKLELVWEGKENLIKPEPRILIENPELSFSVDGEDVSTGNMLIHGDNLLSLKALEKEYSGQIKCIYIDPPYNTGNAFEYYDDNYEHTIWLNLMRSRLEILHKLLKNGGSLWVSIDDVECHYLKVILDEIFGRNSFVGDITYERSGSAGLGQSGLFVNNSERILIYSKGNFEYNKILGSTLLEQKTMKRYNRVLVNEGKKEIVREFKSKSNGESVKVYKHSNFEMRTISLRDFDNRKEEIMNEFVSEFDNLFRTNNVQKENEFQNDLMKDMDKKSLYTVEYIPSRGKNQNKLTKLYYYNSELFAWLKDTAYIENGKIVKTNNLTTVWTHDSIPKADLANEGGVDFPRSKKPEQLIKRILDIATNPNDIVLDSFLGSGTTCAVAQKMGRKWIGIEMGNHAYSHCKLRLDNVINGIDKSGVTKLCGYQGGGSYKFYELAPTLIVKNELGIDVINKEYNAEQLASAIALHEGYSYNPDSSIFWKQSKSGENSYLFVTTSYITPLIISQIEQMMSKEEYLLIACKAFDSACVGQCKQIIIKKIPQMILNLCEFGKDDYNLNIITPPLYEDEEE